MKRLSLILIVIFIMGLVSVNAQEVEDGFSVLNGLSPDTIWKEGITGLQQFVMDLNSLLSPQVVLGGTDQTCSDNAYRVGAALSGRTFRLISTTKEIPSGANWIRIELRDLTNNKQTSSFFLVGEPALFDNLNPAFTYQWYAFACFPTNQAPSNPCSATCQFVEFEDCLSGYIQISGDCPSDVYNCCEKTDTVPSCQEGKSYCFGTGFWGVCENGFISDKGQCESKECQIMSPNFGESKSDVCKVEGVIVCATDTQQCPDGSFVSRDPSNNCQFKSCPTQPQCVEGKSYCFSSGATFQPATYSICENDIFLDKSACESCLIEHPSFGDSKSAVCADVLITDTCKFEGKELKLGDKLDWSCSTLDNTIRIRNVVSSIISSESCGFDLEKQQCGQEKFKQKICDVGTVACIIPGEGIPYTDLKKITLETEDLRDLTSTSLFDSACRRDSECLDLKEDKDVVCRPIATLRADGDLNEAQVDSFFDNAGTIIKGTAIGAGVGAVACGIEAAILAAGLVTLPFAPIGFVACTAIFTAIGATIPSIGIVFDDDDPLVKALKGKDASEVGLCIYKEKEEPKDDDFLNQINPCVWGEKIVEGNGCLVGWAIVGFVLLLLFIPRKS